MRKDIGHCTSLDRRQATTTDLYLFQDGSSFPFDDHNTFDDRGILQLDLSWMGDKRQELPAAIKAYTITATASTTTITVSAVSVTAIGIAVVGYSLPDVPIDQDPS